MQRRAVVVLVLSVVSGLAWTAAATARGAVAPEPESQFVGRIGDERAAASLGGLTVAPDLVDVARHHAQEMADQQRLYHNASLGSDVHDWQKVGENVGVGSSVEEIHQAFMASSSHRDNILDHDFTEVGVGVVADGPDLWVVEVFRLPKAAAPAAAPAGSSAEPSPEPAPETRSADGSSSGGSGSGGVRAAAAGTRPPSATTTPPAPPATAAAPPSTAAPTTVPAPPVTSEPAPVAASPVTPFDASERVRPSSATTVPSVVDRSVITPAPARHVTLPIGLAAGLLVLVVGGLAWQVATDRVRVVSGKPTSSVVDVWELALAA